MASAQDFNNSFESLRGFPYEVADNMNFRLFDPGVGQSLFDDLARLQSGHVEHSLLVDAPLLNGYRLVPTVGFALEGIVSGHPRLPDGRVIVSSQLCYLDAALGVARTLNRFYRLGRPLGTDGH
ncbi:hypothetical protein OIU34_08615 [Pararhizobium sp. BT-229]|uniref:hypothetical protein n=1 Tax=Pararhizobium sp. BT-229 TaxID=2986923 RepID=UPI0021F73C2F|nr:hypothetical protein [Pararhizobium sp. BT-229]MCV9961963.1 hypothetical protein [Pararhizobium sp. BT-229]